MIKARKKQHFNYLKSESYMKDEKENNLSDLRLKSEKNDENINSSCEKTNMESNQAAIKQDLKTKPLGFWSKKLKDLECKENIKNEKLALYEFNGSDGPDSLKKKRKTKKRGAQSKEKKPVFRNNRVVKNTSKVSKTEKKIKEIHRKSFFREQMLLRKEREKLADKGKKFTFSPEMPFLGITSTPSLNKENVVGASNFLFLSPIIKDKTECCHDLITYTPLKRELEEVPKIVQFAHQTPKPEKELKRLSCRRVLRSGKMLNL